MRHPKPENEHEHGLSLVLDALGISMELIKRKQLPFYPLAQDLVIAEIDHEKREYLLVPEAADAWHKLKHAARQDGVTIEIVSAFRSLERQIEIIRFKLDRGMAIETILTLSAPPGYSEHHTGRAVDINTPGCMATEETFEDTDAFRWLMVHAGRFGFTLSYPRENALGFIYEPWHWCFQSGIGGEAGE